MKLEPGSKFSQLEIADAWAKITVQRWQKNIRKLKIGNSKTLYNSFANDVIGAANGDLIKIDFTFQYYGKFVDMGVGKGTKLSDGKQSRTSRRVGVNMLGGRRGPKKWYSRTLFAETMKLTEIMTEQYGNRGRFTVIENIDDNSISR